MNDQFFGITDTGKQRKNNEDTFIAQLSANNKFIIACVIDGVGGYSGGEIAAAITRECILSRLDKPSGEIIPMLIDCFNIANEKIIQAKQSTKEHENMACVCTLAIVDNERNQFYYAHIGDTRLYLVRDHSLVKISHDQSFVGFLEDSGRLTEEEAMNHPKRNEIYKALGLDRQLGKENDDIETGQSPFLPGDMLLLCSDGLTDMLNGETIRAIVTAGNSFKDKCHNLIEEANRNGGKDNITAVLVQNNKPTQQRDSTKPSFVKTNNNEVTKTAGANTERPPIAIEEAGTATTTNKSPLVILFILTLVFLAAAVWQFLQNRAIKISQPVTIAAPVKKSRNKQEIKLQQAIDRSNGHIVIIPDTAFITPIILSDAIQINKDSLVLKIKGKMVLKCDSEYSGPAFVLSSKCKNIVLDSLSFLNFQIGITSFNNAVVLKNVRFINCPAPVQNIFTLQDKKYINGKLPGNFFKADSIPFVKK